MSDEQRRIEAFVQYARSLKGDEKGEAQVFCDRLFQAFGHGGYKEAGATLEFRVKAKGEATKYADLRWKNRLLLEMKRRGEKLHVHYRQAFDYWINAPRRYREMTRGCYPEEDHAAPRGEEQPMPAGAIGGFGT